ncbi:uncharacterized protein LOC135844032 isoform X3 [Planococcus citri]|uniref:uncharacterized protein LOC135844032 isoform X3 n=1 Tax=Planococcus citri TaxID=170843 RepID=UPI0031F912D7
MSSGDERTDGFKIKINLRRGMKRSGKKSKKWQIIRDQNICISRNNDYETFQQELALTKNTIYRKRDTPAEYLSSDDDETLLQKHSTRTLRRRDLDSGSSTSDDDDDDDDETSRQKLDDSVNIISPGERNDEYMNDIRKEVEKVAKEEGKWLKNSNDSFSSITSSDDDAETSEHDIASSHKVSSLGDKNVKYTGDVRKEVEKWAKDSGYWQDESDTDDSSSDDSITDTSVRDEANDESTDDIQELEEYAEDPQDSQGRDSSDESSNVNDVTAVVSELGVFTRGNTDDATVVPQDKLGEDSEDNDERNEPEISADESNGGFPSDCEVVSPNLSVHSVETDSTVISQDEMSEDDGVQKETKTSVGESQQCKKESDGGCASGDNGEEFKLKFSASNKLADMFSQNLQNEQDLRQRIKLYLNDDDGLSEDETNFLHEKLAEVKEQLESFRKKKKAKSSSNLDEKKASSVQPVEFKQKHDENPRNKKKYDDRDEVCSPMDWLNTTSTYLSHLNFSSTRLAESDVKIETIKLEKKMEDSRNEKDDSSDGDFPTPIRIKVEDSRNEKDDSSDGDFPKPIRIKVEDSQNEKDERYVSHCPKPIPIKLEADDRYVSHCHKPIPIKLEADDRYVSDWPKPIPIKLEAIKDKEDDSYNEKRYDRYDKDYNREIEVNPQSGLDSGRSSRMSAEVEQKCSYTRKEDFGNERNYHYNYDQQKEVKQPMVHGSSSRSLLDWSSISTDGGRSYRVGRELDATTKQSSGNGKRNLYHPPIMYYNNRGYHHNKMNRYTGHGYFYSSPNRRTTTESNRKNDFIRKEREKRTGRLYSEKTAGSGRYKGQNNELRSPKDVSSLNQPKRYYKPPNSELQSREVLSRIDQLKRLQEAQIAKLDRKLDAIIRKERKELEKIEEAPTPKTRSRTPPGTRRSFRNQQSCASSPPTKSRGGVKECYYCNKSGHFSRVCKFRLRNIRPVCNDTSFAYRSSYYIF